MAKKTESYAEAVAKLRRLVAEIEGNELDVDLLSEKVQEATRLIKLCKEKLYKVDEDGKVTRLRRECPACGAGVFMAKHADRNTCGRCGNTFK